jgi:hypothetical protein
LRGVGITSGATTYTVPPTKADPTNKPLKNSQRRGRQSRSVEFYNSIGGKADISPAIAEQARFMSTRHRSRRFSTEFFAAPDTLKADAIAARQVRALNEHRRLRDKPLRLADVKQMFLQMRDEA